MDGSATLNKNPVPYSFTLNVTVTRNAQFIGGIPEARSHWKDADASCV